MAHFISPLRDYNYSPLRVYIRCYHKKRAGDLRLGAPVGRPDPHGGSEGLRPKGANQATMYFFLTERPLLNFSLKLE
jgi:hypothetical protein